MARCSLTLFIFAIISAICITACPVRPVQAADITFGLGAGAAPDYEGSDDYMPIPFGSFSVRWDNHMSIGFGGDGLRANLLPSPTFRAGPLMQFIFERDDVEDEVVKKLKPVDHAFMAGGFVGFEWSRFRAGLEASADMAGSNDGFLLKATSGYSLVRTSTWMVSVDASATFADEKYMDAYFSIDAEDSARSGLDRFEAEAGIKDASFGLSVLYSPFERWSILTALGYTRLLGDAADSPVTDDRGDPNQVFGGLAVVYRF